MSRIYKFFLMILMVLFGFNNCKAMNEEIKSSKHWGYGWFDVISRGKLYFYYSTMGAGKSALLIQKFRYFNCSLEKTYVYLPKLLNSTEVSSRNGQSIKVSGIKLEDVPLSSILFIDEAQFLSEDELIEIEELISTKNVAVICFGLLTTFQKELFNASSHLLDLAYVVRELPMTCENCKFNRAMYNFRTSLDNSLISLGKDQYLALCPDCFNCKNYVKFLMSGMADS